MPKIENCSQADVEKGTHKLSPSKTVLIQITDPGSSFVIPYYGIMFEEIYRFKFYDVTEPLYCRGLIEPITQEQANDIYDILVYAFKNNHNVLVHCTAGLCRSGAITEVGVIMGFEAVHENRIPNVEVKSKLLKVMREKLYD